MFKYICTLILFILLLCGSLPAMSFFSTANPGLGLKSYLPTTRGLGMGGVGIALQDDLALNMVNPATWVDMKDTRLNFRYNYTRNAIDFGSESFTTSVGKFAGLSFAIPIYQNKIVTGLSIFPYSDVDFAVRRTITNDVTTYDENIFFKGSISRIQGNLAYAPSDKISFAAAFHYYFGNIDDRHQRVFDNPDFFDSMSEINYKFYGAGFGLSGRAQVLTPLFIGGFVDFKPNLTLREIIYNPLTREDEEKNSDSSLPMKWGIGSSYLLTKRLVIAADYAKQNWSDGFGITGMSTDNLENWYQFAFGLERRHVNSRKAKLLDKFDMRAGYSMSAVGYKFNNESVLQKALHAGVGFLFNHNTARLDISIMAGLRGDRSKTLAQEKFYQLNVSISAGELWFQKYR